MDILSFAKWLEKGGSAYRDALPLGLARARSNSLSQD